MAGIQDYTDSANSNTNIATINIAENCAAANINNALRQLMADILIQDAFSTEITATASLSFASTALQSGYIEVTATGSVNHLGTARAGHRKWVRFKAAGSTVVASSNIVTPSSSNITTAANDVGMFISLGSGNWVLGGGTLFKGNVPFWFGTEGTVSPATNDLVGIKDVSNSNAAAFTLISDILALQSGVQVPVRQTVLSGTVDANGGPSFGGSTGSGTVTQATTLVVAVANGFASTGAVNVVGSITNASWTGLTTNGTMYLYLDVASTGVCTPGSGTLAPTYQWGGTYSTTNLQFTFNIQEMVGKVGNGATAAQTNRIYVGEVTVAGNVTTAITWYQLMGRYLSALTSTLPSLGSNTQVSHNIGTNLINKIPMIILQCLTIDAGYAVGDRIANPMSSDGGGKPFTISYTRNAISFSTGATNYQLTPQGGGSATALTLARWAYQFQIDRGW